jgi:hypothetical protein
MESEQYGYFGFNKKAADKKWKFIIYEYFNGLGVIMVL